ncbi:MAG: hypothetical protein IH589_04375 [Anaerolineales bacterium]|nr:hypothetical protein [Anaerolineales bacterium]
MTSLKDEQRRIVAYLGGIQARLASHKGMISRKGTMSLREWWLNSPECATLSLSKRSLRGVSKPQSATGKGNCAEGGRCHRPSRSILKGRVGYRPPKVRPWGEGVQG